MPRSCRHHSGSTIYRRFVYSVKHFRPTACSNKLPHVRESKTVLDSRFHVTDSGFQLLDCSLCQQNFYSSFQSLVGFRFPWAVFRIPKPRIPDSTRKNFSDYGIRIPLVHRAEWKKYIYNNQVLYFLFCCQTLFWASVEYSLPFLLGGHYFLSEWNWRQVTYHSTTQTVR